MSTIIYACTYIKLHFDAIHVKRDKICGFTILHIHFVFIIRCGRLNAKKAVVTCFFGQKHALKENVFICFVLFLKVKISYRVHSF